MEIYIFMDITKEVEFKQKFLSSIKNYKKYFLYYMHSTHFYIFKFCINENAKIFSLVTKLFIPRLIL